MCLLAWQSSSFLETNQTTLAAKLRHSDMLEVAQILIIEIL